MTTTIDRTTPSASAFGPASPDAPIDTASRTGRRARSVAVRLGRLAWASAAILIFLLLWEFGPTYLLDEGTRVFLPPLHVDVQATWTLIQNGQMQSNLTASLTRSATGFFIALALAIPLGILIGWYRRLDRFLNPLLEVFRNTAALALLPVFVLLLGIGDISKITIIAYASFFPVLLNTVAGVRAVDPLLIRAARSLGLSSPRLFAHVVLPSAVPTIFTGIRMAGSASILVLIAAEMVGAKAGLGYLIVNAQSSFQIPQMYAGIIATSVVGVAINYGLVRLERHFSRWRTEAALAR